MSNTSDQRDFSTVSPSAKALLLLKGLTEIPFAREAAAIIMRPEAYSPDYSNKTMDFWGRVVHFEVRYESINRLLDGLGIKNILELSSGFSFRSLDRVQKEQVYYIDTDLPGVIGDKLRLVDTLRENLPAPQGTLEVLPLNALDEQQFAKVVQKFPDGPLAIVNEGLLMYLDDSEKEKLCSIIHGILKQRGGYWITADIYFKNAEFDARPKTNDELQRFLDKHKVDENKFDSPEAAEAFFKKNGFVVDKEADPDYAAASSLRYLMETIPPEQRGGKAPGRFHTTWRLRAV